MKVKDLPPATDLSKCLLAIPDNVEQLTDKPLKHGYIAMIHNTGQGVFMSSDSPTAKKRQLIPTYPINRSDIREWEVIATIVEEAENFQRVYAQKDLPDVDKD